MELSFEGAPIPVGAVFFKRSDEPDPSPVWAFWPTGRGEFASVRSLDGKPFERVSRSLSDMLDPDSSYEPVDRAVVEAFEA